MFGVRRTRLLVPSWTALTQCIDASHVAHNRKSDHLFSRTCIRLLKGKASFRPIENIPCQKPYDTYFLKRVASLTSGRKAKRTKEKHRTRFTSSASDRCFSLQMKFPRGLPNVMPKTLFDHKLHATREKTNHAQKLGLSRLRSA